MENRLGVLLAVAGAAVIGSFCVGQNWPIPDRDDDDDDSTVVTGGQCPACCLPNSAWQRVNLPGGGVRFVRTNVPCPTITALDSASPDPGGTYTVYALSFGGDSASPDPGNRIDSIVLFAHR